MAAHSGIPASAVPLVVFEIRARAPDGTFGGSMIRVIIPVLNEEKSIAAVLKAIPAEVAEIIVVDNGCTDRTMEFARSLGVTVVAEPRKGYGAACLRGIQLLQEDTSVVVFL